MRIITFLLCFITVCSSFSCKKATNANATVVKNCTGVYLQINTSNYKVCNKEILNNYEGGEKVNASFRIANDNTCKAKDDVICMMAFPFKDWVVIIKVE